MPNMCKKTETVLFNGELIECYPENTVPPFISSPLDDAKFENDDVGLDEVLANNGGRFIVCGADILNAKW